MLNLSVPRPAERIAAETAALVAERETLQALVGRETDLEVESALGHADADAQLARCQEAARRLPEIEHRLGVLRRAAEQAHETQRVLDRQRHLDEAARLRPALEEKVREAVAALDAARAAVADLTEIADEIDAAQSAADTFRRSPSEPNGYPVPTALLAAAGAWRADFIGDKWNASRFEVWRGEVDAAGVALAGKRGKR
jgi:hypothetical protein